MFGGNFGSDDPVEFEIGATYLGGHPDLTKPCLGKLALRGGTLSFIATPTLVDRLRKRRVEGTLVVDVSRIERVEFLGRDEIRKAPKGYVGLALLPGLTLAPGYGGQPQLPVGLGKLTKLLNVAALEGTRELSIVFANTGPQGRLFPWKRQPLEESAPERYGLELANRLLAARARAGPLAAATRD